LSNKPELGGTIVFVHAEAQYLEFSMSASVQGWRTKWFYIKDRKASSDDEYGLAPFDAFKELKKLSSWDSAPTDAKIEEIASLLKEVKEALYRVFNSWCSLCNIGFNPCSIVFPSFGTILAW
jgi:hypothetical protein